MDNDYIRLAQISHKFRLKSSKNVSWQLRWKPVCGSTEHDLSKWLEQNPSVHIYPKAVIAARQNYGIGQNGNVWESAKGGIWISAAFPIEKEVQSPQLLRLTIALALAKRLEDRNIPVKIKWPNDLYLNNKKLGGILSRLIHRGRTIMMGRIGIGLNICNRTPREGISLYQFTYPKHQNIADWGSEVLLAIDDARELLFSQDYVRNEVKKRLIKDQLIDPITGKLMEVKYVDENGYLVLEKDK